MTIQESVIIPIDIPFKGFGKIQRLSRECIITEKIDGTNGVIYIGVDGEFRAGKRTSWITPENDNYGFAKWAYEHKEELMTLGPGYHYGEWWGDGIQRRYNLKEKRFSLFNVSRWNSEVFPACCYTVPILYVGLFDTNNIKDILNILKVTGSVASPGFMKPEGIVIHHVATGINFKKTLENDEHWKTKGKQCIDIKI